MSREPAHPVLVIGYGNALRGDDAVGRQVAERVAASAPPGVETISVTQLVPELAVRIAEARAVIFIDASAESDAHEVAFRELTCIDDPSAPSHATGPRELLTLAGACYGRWPSAWLVTVPTIIFEFSEHLSQSASKHLYAAVRTVEQLLDRLRENEAVHA
jgi:hydrogenase maturation protease